MFKNDAQITYVREPINRVMNKIWEYPLTVIEAPMGYGKTTAVREYLKGSHVKVLWQTLLDGSETVFWHEFSSLFEKLNPAAVTSLLGIGIPNNSVFAEEAVCIVEEIRFSVKTVLVFDDYHLLSSEHIDRFIELLIRAEIPNLHVVIVSRSIFGDNTAELELKGYCLVIDKNNFVLSREEILAYCTLCGLTLNTEELDFLVSYTEGWISAVYLCVLGFLQEGRIEHQVGLYELIEKFIYRRISTQTQEFLLRICIFDAFTLKQVEHMWGKGNGEMIIRQLALQSAFIRYNKTTKIYYMHNIFTSYLQELFNGQDVEQRQITWRKAGEWYVSSGQYIQALDYFYKAGDFDPLLTAIEMDKGHGIWTEHKEKVIQYFQECPVEIKQRHIQACLIYAINLFSFNEMELFAEQCKDIGAYIEMLPEEKAQEQGQLAGELELLVSFAKYNHIAGMLEHIQRASQLVSTPSEFIDPNSSWTFGAPSVLYMFYRERGQLGQTVRDMEEAIGTYCRLTSGHGAGAESAMLAEQYYYQGDFKNAEIVAHKALYKARSEGQTSIVICALFIQLRLAAMTGEVEKMKRILTETREEIKARNLYLYLHTWEMCEAFIYSYLKVEKKIAPWIIKGDLQAQSIYFPSYAFFNIIWGKILLLRDQYVGLSEVTESFMEVAGVFPNLLGKIYTYIYDAAAKYQLGQLEDAQVALKKALEIATPDQVLMPFVENGEYIIDILRGMSEDSQYSNLIGRVIEGFPMIEKNRVIMSSQLSNVNCKLFLSEREWMIAELISTGMPNKEIGKTLHIAEVTVKKNLQKIYNKLGINSRNVLAKLIIEQKIS